MNPIHATQGFYKFFEMPTEELRDFPLKDEIIGQSKDRPANVGRKQFTCRWEGGEFG
jgi:hypothetical protein